jgi:HD-GYP domain-containing protein (c-di-GMP phosphodiesterase class II)
LDTEADLEKKKKNAEAQTGANVGRTGSTYVYVGAEATLTATAPEDLIGLAWADGRTVENANWQPFPDFSGNGELMVTTGAYALVDSIIDNPDALMWVGRLRDTDFNAANHGVKVGLYLVGLGRHLGLPRRHLAELALIGMLADVGKVKVARSLLDKPGMLTPREFAKVKEHVRLGLNVIGTCDALPDGVELGIAQHHERLDGSGYPGGLKGDAISLYGRMAAIADSFAALITPRAYADASSPQDALMNLCEWAGSSFDEPLVEQFVQTVGAFPVGSLVELSTGEVAIVVTHGRGRPSGPKVLVLTWPDKNLLDRPVERTLPRLGETPPGGLRILAGLPVGAYRIQPKDYYELGPVDRT